MTAFGLERDHAARWRMPFSARLSAVVSGVTWIVFAGVHLASLTRFPAVSVDEAHLITAAWVFAQKGFPPDLSLLPGQNIAIWMQYLSISALGLSLFTSRLVSLAAGLALLVGVFYLVTRLYGTRMGWVAAFVVAFSPSFAISAHLARHDVIIAALGYGAVALCLTGHGKGAFRTSLAAGLAIGIGFDIHPNAILFAPVAIGALAVCGDLGTNRILRLKGLAIGLVIGLALSFARTGAARLSVAFAPSSIGYSRRPPLFSLDPGLLLDSAGETAAIFLGQGPERLLLLVIALCGLLWRPRRQDLVALIVFTVLLSEFIFLLSMKPFYYWILIGPATDILFVALLAKATAMRRSLQRSVSVALVAGLILASQITLARTVLEHDAMADYNAVAAKLSENIGRDSVILGDETFWFGLPYVTYYESQRLPFYWKGVQGATLYDAFLAYRPDYFIMRPDLQRFSAKTPDEVHPALRFLYIPKEELDAFLSDRGQLLVDMRTDTYRHVQLYRLHWLPDDR